MKPSEPAAADTGASTFKARLDQYSISNGRLVYDDNEGNMHLSIDGLNHEGSGDISANRFTLNTHTTASATDFSYANIPYLNKTAVLLDAVLDVEVRLTVNSDFSKAKAKLNDMELGADGFFQLVNDSTYAMDISFKTPSSDFKSILSLVPTPFTKMILPPSPPKAMTAFDGFVKGQYSPTQIPGTTARVANRLEAPWHVIYIETPAQQRLPEERPSHPARPQAGRGTGRPDGNLVGQRCRGGGGQMAYARDHNLSKIFVAHPLLIAFYNFYRGLV